MFNLGKLLLLRCDNVDDNSRRTMELLCVIGHALANPKNKRLTGGLLPDELQAIINVARRIAIFINLLLTEIHRYTF